MWPNHVQKKYGRLGYRRGTIIHTKGNDVMQEKSAFLHWGSAIPSPEPSELVSTLACHAEN